ncbi:DUF7115 domain-containing protein [Salinirubrum litoreum]|uniref:DUF7115 domain-containing protein n=1 Tax=Salinirubrum litoreum TaxID=1126234 RepID=A0ABD5R7R0_9EURY|nr:hypothetical protein [Salinirubrum litoreum]
MDLPEIVQTALDGEGVAARVDLGGEDDLLVTPTRTLIYRAEGLLSDESVEEYPHDAERIEVSEGRRKSKITLDYGLDGEETFAVPSKRLQDALHPVIAGVMNAAGITDPGETVKQTFRFSELTLVVTSARVVKHIGTAVWDEDYEEYHYDDVTDLTFEDGSVATSIVLEVGGRQERIKAPNDAAREVREGLESALLAYYDVGSLEEFRVAVAPEEDDEETDDENVSFGDGPTPLDADPADLSEEPQNATRSADADADAESAGETDALAGGSTDTGANAQAVTQTATDAESADDDTFASAGFEPATDDAGDDTADTTASAAELQRLSAQVSELTETVEHQSELIERQQQTIETLIAELRQGR